MLAELALATAEAAIAAHFDNPDPEPGSVDSATVPGGVLLDYAAAGARRDLLARLSDWLASGEASAV